MKFKFPPSFKYCISCALLGFLSPLLTTEGKLILLLFQWTLLIIGLWHIRKEIIEFRNLKSSFPLSIVQSFQSLIPIELYQKQFPNVSIPLLLDEIKKYKINQLQEIFTSLKINENINNHLSLDVHYSLEDSSKVVIDMKSKSEIGELLLKKIAIVFTQEVGANWTEEKRETNE